MRGDTEARSGVCTGHTEGHKKDALGFYRAETRKAALRSGGVEARQVLEGELVPIWEVRKGTQIEGEATDIKWHNRPLWLTATVYSKIAIREELECS